MPSIHPMYRNLPPEAEQGIAQALENARPGQCVFFRADDAAVPSASFFRLARLFLKHRAPLDLAVVPAWLTEARFGALCSELAMDDPLFCLHMHGYRHLNHEKAGKKCEFADSRSAPALREDLSRGRARLASILGPLLFPAFTPPWNRCGQKTLDALAGLGFAAVSRSSGARPAAPAGLCSIDVSVDLHTRKDPDAPEAWRALFGELAAALSAPAPCGVMIHHQRMNGAAFTFLDRLLSALSKHPGIVLQNFQGLLGKRTGPDGEKHGSR